MQLRKQLEGGRKGKGGGSDFIEYASATQDLAAKNMTTHEQESGTAQLYTLQDQKKNKLSLDGKMNGNSEAQFSFLPSHSLHIAKCIVKTMCRQITCAHT